MNAKILCVASDLAVRESRCAVLKYSGYDVMSASPQLPETLPRSRKFDLIILSSRSDADLHRVVNFSDGAEVLVLDEFILPSNLLSLVAQRLQQSASLLNLVKRSQRRPLEIVPLSEVPRSVSCEEKARRVKEYDDATLAFSDAVQELRRRIGTSPKAEYERLERISTAARVQSELARLALEQHIAIHHC